MLQQGNVLVIGSGGVGVSTLVHAVLGSDARVTLEGSGVRCYERDGAPFRLIDAGDIGGSALTRRHAIRQVRRWSRENALDGNGDNDIHAIWFCVEGKSRKLIRQQIRSLSAATDVWRQAPIIVVITKSYAELERDDNVALVRAACARRRRLTRCLRAVIPVVAEPFRITDAEFVPPTGIIELIESTKQVIPEGVATSAADVDAFVWRRRRSQARAIVAASTVAAAGVGAVPLPIADAMVLTPLETTMISSLTRLYDIGDASSSKQLLATILEAGTVSTAAKAVVSGLKAVPGVNVAAGVLNAATAGAIVATMGEATTRVFEHIARGERSVDDIAWVRSFVESSLAKDAVRRGTKLLAKVGTGSATSEQQAIIYQLAQGLVGDGSKRP